MAHHLPLEITREDGLWMARSPAVQGLLVTGQTIDQLLNELPKVAEALFDVCQEKGWAFVTDAPDIRLADIVWIIEVPHHLPHTA
jgi:predicted RNase H-like HicB family nuclease